MATSLTLKTEPCYRHFLRHYFISIYSINHICQEHEYRVKHELLLVDKSYDDIKKGAKGFFDPEMSRMQDMIAEDTEIIDELLSTLTNKGLLSLQEIDRIRAKASERVWDREREFYRMKDIDDA